jgi:tRNA (mo5U34)-methyltransferase
MLDTHYALESDAGSTYVGGGGEYRYKRYHEYGLRDPFSGLYDHSKWLRLDDIVSILRGAGFGTVDIVELREERNGPRVLLFADKPLRAA